MIQNTELRIETQHVNSLLKLLENYAEEHLSEVANHRDWRLFFADADLLSAYIDGFCKNPLKSWESLLSLENKNLNGHADKISTNLANVTGQAIGRYIFDSFLDYAKLQRNRIYITPEHEREFKSIIYAVLTRSVVDNEQDWLGSLSDDYITLSESGGDPDRALAAAQSIVKTLESNVGVGKIERAYSLLRRSITLLSTNIISSSSNDFDSILFSATNPQYMAYVDMSRKSAWSSFESDLKGRIGNIEEIFSLKKYIFDLHDAVHGAQRPYGYFLASIKHWMESGKSPQKLQGRSDLEQQIKIAVREAADLSACARTNGMGLWLNHVQPPPTGQQWKVIFLSGSRLLQRVVEHWDSRITPCILSVVHPLAMLRHVDLWDPDGAKRLNDAGYTDESHEFALFRILGVTNYGPSNHEELDLFATSLQKQLEIVVAREAYFHDRGLKQLRDRLSNRLAFNANDFSEEVRNLITQRFAQTYECLAELFPGEKTLLPANSLPTLDLSSSPAAASFLSHVRSILINNNKKTSIEFKDLEKSLREDRTGYSALLALATGYMAKGKQWIPAAQTMAATAALLAKGRHDGDLHPEGNEALYLEAFLLRMNQKSDCDLNKFSEKHRRIINESRKTLSLWRERFPESAEEPIEKSSPHPTRGVWIDFRYKLENNARDVFCALIRRINNIDFNLKEISGIAKDSFDLYKYGDDISKSISQENLIWFAKIQAGLSVLQAWLLWHESSVDVKNRGVDLDIFEELMEPFMLDLYPERYNLGELLPALVYIYSKKTGRARKWNTKRSFEKSNKALEIRFAGIDEDRMKWLGRHIQNL